MTIELEAAEHALNDYYREHPDPNGECSGECAADLAAVLGALVDSLFSPPADDVREALYEIIRFGGGDEMHAVDRILSRFEVRLRGTVTDTDAEVDAAHGAFCGCVNPRCRLRERSRAALEAARGARVSAENTTPTNHANGGDGRA